MDLLQKLTLLGAAAKYDLGSVSDATGRFGGSCAQQPPDVRPYISHVTLPSGHRKPVLKVLQTSFCERNCHYCGFRAGRDVPRAELRPGALAAAFDQAQRRGLVQGLFLSSAVAGSLRTMDLMVATAEIVRRRYDYRGYVHLKILPDAEQSQIERAVRLADRVSVNLESPNPERLQMLAPRKDFDRGLMLPLRRAAAAIAAGRGRWTPLGLTTQFVVGAVGEADHEILSTTQGLYDQVNLARAYFSPFAPVPDTPLQGQPAVSVTRQHRLYQADFLMRRYGFRLHDLAFDDCGNLPTGTDPKLAAARLHPELFPIEVNRAPKQLLLRVPGIGPVTARKIMRERRQATIRSLSHLRAIGVLVDRAAPFLLIDGRAAPQQLSLFGIACYSAGLPAPRRYSSESNAHSPSTSVGHPSSLTRSLL